MGESLRYSCGPLHPGRRADERACSDALVARIREIRTSRGFSQESFAEAYELNRTHISLLERGRINVTVNTTRQMAHVLQISLSELFRGLG